MKEKTVIDAAEMHRMLDDILAYGEPLDRTLEQLMRGLQRFIAADPEKKGISTEWMDDLS
jgi:hypothetical protein